MDSWHVLGDVWPWHGTPAEVVHDDEDIYQSHGRDPRGCHRFLLRRRYGLDHSSGRDLTGCHQGGAANEDLTTTKTGGQEQHEDSTSRNFHSPEDGRQEKVAATAADEKLEVLR